MPQCSCFHAYDLKQPGPGEFLLTVPLEGTAHLNRILDNSTLAQVVSGERDSTWWNGVAVRYAYVLCGVRDKLALRAFLDLLRNRVIIDLAPALDECYALGPNSLKQAPEDDRPNQNGPFGELVYKAKRKRNKEALGQLCQEMANFVSGHPRYWRARFVVAVSPSTAASANLPSHFASCLGGKVVMKAQKTRQTTPQKELLAAKNETALQENIAGSVGVAGSFAGASIIVVDDICGSGATLVEVARACRIGGAKEVLGLVAAKDATFMQGGVSLLKEYWQ